MPTFLYNFRKYPTADIYNLEDCGEGISRYPKKLQLIPDESGFTYQICSLHRSTTGLPGRGSGWDPKVFCSHDEKKHKQ